MTKSKDKFVRDYKEYLKTNIKFQMGMPVSSTEIADWAEREGRLPELTQEDKDEAVERWLWGALLDQYIEEKGMPPNAQALAPWLLEKHRLLLGEDDKLLDEVLEEKKHGEPECWIFKEGTQN